MRAGASMEWLSQRVAGPDEEAGFDFIVKAPLGAKWGVLPVQTKSGRRAASPVCR